MNAMGRPKSYDRDEVLEKALLLFWQKGFEGTHLNELVETTGLNRFSLYKEFGSKEGLFEEAMTLYMGQLGTLVEYLEKEPLGIENITAYFDALVSYRFRHGCFLVNTLSEKNLLRPGTYKQVQDFLVAGRDLFQANLDASKKRGELASKTDTKQLARFLVVYEIGLLTYGILDSRKAARRETLSYLDKLLR